MKTTQNLKMPSCTIIPAGTDLQFSIEGLGFYNGEEIQRSALPLDALDVESWSATEMKHLILKKKVKHGQMHKLLKLKPEQEIDEAFKTGKDLVLALMKATKNNLGKVTKMITFMANMSKKRNLYDDALNFIRKQYHNEPPLKKAYKK